jgi:rod shape-determining protein MreC
MESLLHRYRNITVLFVAIIAQIAAIAWQVRKDDDVPLLRIWAVSAVTPVASAIENLRSGAFGVFTDYFSFQGTRNQSRELRSERDRLRLENQLLKNELAEAQRAGALAGFEAHSPSKMIGARVIGATTGVGTRSVLIDRGKVNGVERGMAVVTPDGIVGKVLAVYPFASQVLSVTDAGFAAAIETQKNHVRGVLRGMGNSTAKIDYVPGGQKVEKGEAFFTSGDDRLFPRGMPAGRILRVEDGPTFQDIYAEPYGAEAAPEEVFVIVDPVNGKIPDAPPDDSPVFLAPENQVADPNAPQAPSRGTQADQMIDQYRKIGAAQNHVMGEGNPGSLPPNFNLKVPGVNVPVAAAGSTGGTGMASARAAAVTPIGAAGGRASTGTLVGAGGRAAAGTLVGVGGRAATGSSGGPVGRPMNAVPRPSGASGGFARSATGVPRLAANSLANSATGVARPASGAARAAAGASGFVRRIPRPIGASGAIVPGVGVAAKPATGGATQR